MNSTGLFRVRRSPAAQRVARALGAPRGGRGGDVPHLDRGQPTSSGIVSGTARGQASAPSSAECPASLAVLKLRLVAAWRQFLRHYYRQIARSNGRAPNGKGGSRVEVVTPAAIAALHESGQSLPNSGLPGSIERSEETYTGGYVARRSSRRDSARRSSITSGSSLSIRPSSVRADLSARNSSSNFAWIA